MLAVATYGQHIYIWWQLLGLWQMPVAHCCLRLLIAYCLSWLPFASCYCIKRPGSNMATKGSPWRPCSQQCKWRSSSIPSSHPPQTATSSATWNLRQNVKTKPNNKLKARHRPHETQLTPTDPIKRAPPPVTFNFQGFFDLGPSTTFGFQGHHHHCRQLLPVSRGSDRDLLHCMFVRAQWLVVLAR